jgi:hypothetical protein
MKVIVSMATIPSRKNRLLENIPSLIHQRYHYDKLIINVLDNLSDEDYEFYNNIAQMDVRISINKVEDKWKSCNKLLPVLKLFPDDIIITVDDDIFYPNDCIGTLMRQYVETPDCIIAQETNPIVIENEKIKFINMFDVKLMQKSWSKYLSGCCLFPPHVFDGSNVFDWDKMMEVTNGTHDELWFWINSTLNGVRVIGLNYIWTFEFDVITKWKDDEFKLSNININEGKAEVYLEKINEIYGKELLKMLRSQKAEFTIHKDNALAFISNLNMVNKYYSSKTSYGYSVKAVDLTKGWSVILNRILNS